MQPPIATHPPSAGDPADRPVARRGRVRLVRALSALLLLAVLATALLVHLIWNAVAGRNLESIVGMLNAGAASTVGRELALTLDGAEGAAEIIRSALFQGTIEAADEAKREFLFLSVLRSQPALSWIGFGFPDGRFFGAHAESGRIEMIEIGSAPPGEPRPLRRDRYRPIPGDVIFEERTGGDSIYVVLGAPWYRAALAADGPVRTMAEVLPAGFEPAAIVSTRLDRYGEMEGVIMVAVGLNRLSALLSDLDVAKDGVAFLLDPGGRVLAASALPGMDRDGNRPARLDAYPAADRLAHIVAAEIEAHPEAAFETLADDPVAGPVYVTATGLPFQDWRLVTAIPRAVFAGEIDRASRFLPVLIGLLALLAAGGSAILAGLLFARPLRRLSAQLASIARFRLDEVHYEPSFLAELDEFSGALHKMALGLDSFGRYIPVDVVRKLVGAGTEPKPGGELRPVTVMFADLPGFTGMSEALGPGIEPYLTQFLTIAVAAIDREGGTVDKFIGDEVMALWNAPGDIDDHAGRACRAALAIRAAMHAVPHPLPADTAPDRAPPGGQPPAPRVRIGIHTGTAIVGNIGSPTRLSYTAIGDTVNLASRLVGVAKDHGVEIVVSEETRAAAAGPLPTRPLGIVQVRGRVEPVPIHALEQGPADGNLGRQQAQSA